MLSEIIIIISTIRAFVLANFFQPFFQKIRHFPAFIIGISNVPTHAVWCLIRLVIHLEKHEEKEYGTSSNLNTNLGEWNSQMAVDDNQ